MRNIVVVLAAATLYLALSGFDCASTEMTTAKVALQRKDLQKAEESLKKELAARPQNGEAWMLLGEVYEQQKRYPEMGDAYAKAMTATQPALKAEDRTNLFAKRYNLWLENFNSALALRETGTSSGNPENFREALQKIDAAMLVRPGYPDNYYVRAALYRDLKDDAATNKAYMDYAEAARADVEAGMKEGLALGMTAAQVESALGKPTKNTVGKEGGYFLYSGKELYVYFSPESDEGPSMVEGWHYFAGDPTPDNIRVAQYTLRGAPYYALGIDAYFEGERNPARYNDALKYLQMVEKFDRQQNVGQVIADIYAKTNRTGEAKKSFEDNIRQNPNDPALYINYGTLLVNLKDYPAAIENFKKVLPLTTAKEERHLTALFNLGAVYKNWGANLQDSIRNVTRNESKAQMEVYMAKLRESRKYFEDYRKQAGDDDFMVLSELANLYIVLDEQQKLTETVRMLESMEARNAQNYDYWRAMEGIYAVLGDTRKGDAAAAKAKSLE